MALTWQYGAQPALNIIRHGVVVALYPAFDVTTGQWSTDEVEVRRAPDAAGVPGTPETIIRLTALAAAGNVFIDQRDSDGATWWYSYRHMKGDYGGPWTEWTSAIAQELTPNEQRLKAAPEVILGGGGGSLPIGSVLTAVGVSVCPLDPTFGAMGDDSTDDSAALNAAFATGLSVDLAGRNYRANNLVQTAFRQTIFSSSGFSSITKNANGPLFTSSGNECHLKNIGFRGESATPAFTGDNVVATGSNFHMMDCGSRWAYGRAVKSTNRTVIRGSCDIYQTADQSATGYDIEIGVSGTATLFHEISGIYTSQHTGGIKITDGGGWVIKGVQFGKLNIALGTGPAGVNGGRTLGCRIHGDVTVGISNATFTGNQFSIINFVINSGVTGVLIDPSNNWESGSTLLNNGIGANLLMRSVGLGGLQELKFGDDASLAVIKINHGVGDFELSGNVTIPNNKAFKILNAAGGGGAFWFMSPSNDTFFQNPITDKAIVYEVTGTGSGARHQFAAGGATQAIINSTGVVVGTDPNPGGAFGPLRIGGNVVVGNARAFQIMNAAGGQGAFFYQNASDDAFLQNPVTDHAIVYATTGTNSGSRHQFGVNGVTKFWIQNGIVETFVDLKVATLGTFDSTVAPTRDQLLSFNGTKWVPRTVQLVFNSGVLAAANLADGTAVSYAFAAPTYPNSTPAVPPTPVVVPTYKGMLVYIGAIPGQAPPANTSYVIDYSVNGAAYSTDAIVTTGQAIVHSLLDPTKTYAYKVKGRGKADGTFDSAYSSASAATNPSTLTEVNPFGLVVASQIATINLAAIHSNLGIIVNGRIDNLAASPTAGILVGSGFTKPGTWTRYLDLTAAGSDPFFKHEKLSLNADGKATFNGNIDITQSVNYGSSAAIYWSTRNTTIAHGITTYAPTDMFGHVTEWQATVGGMRLSGFTESGVGIVLSGYVTDPGAGAGAVLIEGWKKSGTGVVPLSGTERICTFMNEDATKLAVRHDGALEFITANLTTTAPTGASKWFKVYDDTNTAHWVLGKPA